MCSICALENVLTIVVWFVHRNKRPDVVRFGDLDIFSTVGDEYAQQFKIAEIIRHPSHRFNGHYHDVALLRLEKSVTWVKRCTWTFGWELSKLIRLAFRINEAVIPACLWLDAEVRFKRMHATGWGNVGFGTFDWMNWRLANVFTYKCAFQLRNNHRFYSKWSLIQFHTSSAACSTITILLENCVRA